MSEQRLIDIETKISHQEFLIEQLNEVVRIQQETIDRLEKSLKIVASRLGETDGKKVGPANEKPPHY